MTRTARGTNRLFGMLALALLTSAILPGAAESAVICDPGEIAALGLTVLTPDSVKLAPPSVAWELQPTYPPGGTRLDFVNNSYYSLTTEFDYFGLAADFDPQETQPPHYFLPLNWRTYDMVSLVWHENAGEGRLVRQSRCQSGIWIQDPAPGSQPTDTMTISPRVTLYGSYNGFRDQVFQFNWRAGDLIAGDVVFSVMDPTLVAWSPSDSLADLIPDPGDTVTTVALIDWRERFEPDQEFNYAPGDEALSGTITLSTTYERIDADSVEVLATNIHCAHELKGVTADGDSLSYGLYVQFSSGALTLDYTYEIIVEAFEGYHVWRKVEGNPEGWVNIWDISRNEERDKEYWWWIAGYFQPNAPPNYGYLPASLTAVFGLTDERLYLDFDIHNGFSYDYAVTSFDRGFRPSSGDNDRYVLDSVLGLLISEDNLPIDVSMAPLDSIADPLVFNWPAGASIDNSVFVVPNPLRTGKSAREDPNYHNYPGDVVRFVGMTPRATIKIFTLAGDLVFEAEHNDPSSANAIWDTRNLAGELVASGVYVYRVTNPENEEEYGRLVIIR
ncbi:MAG: hypothetical protein JW819_06550 [Candidatus Krumholzibacteriota bacterium]|nr:hypothetical protein [Candidatus Krumholzibacteriota bacterium]